VKVVLDSFEDSLEVSSLCSILHPKSSNDYCEALPFLICQMLHTQHNTSRRRGSYRDVSAASFSRASVVTSYSLQAVVSFEIFSFLGCEAFPS